MRKVKIARRYAKAFAELAFEKGIAPRVSEETSALKRLFEEEISFRTFMLTFKIKPEVKFEIIQKLFSHKFSPLTLNFIKTVLYNRRQIYLLDILNEFQNQYDIYSNVLSVTAITPDRVPEKINSMIKKSLSGIYQKQIHVRNKIDPSILGGIILRVNNTVLDGSLARNLSKLRDSLIR